MRYTDEQIIRAISSGRDRDDAFRELYRQCGPMVRKLGNAIGIPDEDIKDILQDAIIVFWQKLKEEGFAGRSKISTFIVQVCKFKFYNRLSRSPKFTDIGTLEAMLSEQPSVDKEQETEHSYLEELAVRYLGDLTERCQQLIMGLYQGRKMEQMAADLGYSSAANATNQRYKCMQKLRSMFKPTVR